MTLWNISASFPAFCSCTGQVAHVLRTRTPLVINGIATIMLPYDLHVLSLPPAFILSQDQTLHCICFFAFLPVFTGSLSVLGLSQFNTQMYLQGCLLLLSICSKNFPFPTPPRRRRLGLQK